MNCAVCASAMEERFRATVMKRHAAAYYRCPRCGYLCTEPPYWLDEAYRSPINASDTGILQRNLTLSRLTAVLLYGLHGRSGRFVDYAGGHGILTRLMRDLGFDFYWHDPYCPNLFARGFEYSMGGWKPDLLTCYEAFEHFVSPPEELEKMLAVCRNILFTTELLPQPVPSPGEWRYYGLDHGQHVSFYSPETLERLAGRYRLNLVSDGRSIHLLSDRKVGNARFRALLALGALCPVRLLRAFSGGRTESDMERIRSAGA
jgi:hypothetical protein